MGMSALPKPSVGTCPAATVRTTTYNNQPAFILSNVCKVLEIAMDTAARLDDDEKGDVGNTDAIGRQQVTTVINESGLYSLILTSRKSQAKAFRGRWSR